jgi:hypothetical protein
MPGDQVGSGETVVNVSVGARTPRGKVEVTLEKGERSRFEDKSLPPINRELAAGDPGLPLLILKLKALSSNNRWSLP